MNALTVYLGSNAIFHTNFPFPVLAVDEVPKIILERNAQGQIAITMDLSDHTGDIVAEIKQSEFTINPNNHFRIVRRDRSSLAVYIPRWKEEVLNIEYLNPSEVKITGVFNYPGTMPVRVTEDALLLGGWTIRRECYGMTLVGINIVTNRRTPVGVKR